MAMELNGRPQPARVTKSGVARQHTRYLFSVPVTVRRLVRGGFQTTRGVSLNICEGGVSAIVQASLSVGETVEINLPLPKGRIQAVAIVRHVTDGRSGLEFIGLTPEERHQIDFASKAL